MNRREFLSASVAAASAPPGPQTILVDPTPRFEISPYLYMQFMEPLGTTDGSVETAWDYDIDDWRRDFVAIAKDLAPGAIRFGGLFSRYYNWRDGVGPPEKRPWTRNYAWGGKETNRVGTGEFADLCRRTGAEPLCCVNFLSDGVKRYRAGDAAEAADWVSYANDPANRERRAHGHAGPYGIKLWQIGNETSYGTETFDRDSAIAHTIEFARAMKARDPSIRLIGWGDRGRPDGRLWAGELARRAGEYLDYVAIHMMGQSPNRPDTVLKGTKYQRDPRRAWSELLELTENIERRVAELEDAVPRSLGLAITEGHLSLSPHNTNPILREWLSAAYHARSFNIYQRHGARVKIATAADFEGSRWTVNAVMLETPRKASYLMPVGCIARFFKRHNGKQGIGLKACPRGLDIAASRTGNGIWLHVANLEYSQAVQADFAAEGLGIAGGRVIEIAPGDLREDDPGAFAPRESALAPDLKWRFKAGSVSAVELEVAPHATAAGLHR